MTWRARWWLAPAALLGVLAAGVVFLTATEAGLRLLWPRIAQSLPGELAADTIEGRLIGPLSLRNLRYRRDDTVLAIERLDLNWRPTALLLGRLRITRLHADGVALVLPKAPDETSSAAFTPPAVPLTVSISDARLDRASVTRGGETLFRLESAAFDLRLDRNALEIRSFAARAEPWRLNASGRVALAGEIAADLRTDWTVALSGKPEIRGTGRVSGGLAALRLDQRVVTPADAHLQAVLQDWSQQPRWEAKLELAETDLRRLDADWPALALGATADGGGDFDSWSVAGNFRMHQQRGARLNGEFVLRRTPEAWTLERLELRQPGGAAHVSATARYPARGATRALKLDADWGALAWPLAGDAAVTSQRGRLRLAGTAQSYTLRLDAAIAGGDLPPGDWNLRGHGDTAHLVFDRVEARLLDGRVTGRGRLAWRPDLAWQLTLTGDSLDPGRHWRGWPGRLAFTADTHGKRRRDRLQAGLTLGELHGELRGQSLAGAGGLFLDGDDYRLDDLRLDIGKATLRAAGVLADRWDLRWELRIDDLAALSPAQGRLASEGRMTGTRATPHLTATAQLKNFTLDPRRMARLDADLALEAVAEQRDLAGRLRIGLPDGDHVEGRLRLPGLMARTAPLERQALTGELNARLRRLDLLPAFFPDVEDTRGELLARFALGGTLGDPRATGRITLTEGAAQVPRLGLSLQAITLTAESSEPGRFRFDGRLRSGSELRFNGRMQWTPGEARDWSAELALKGERVEAVNIPEAWVLVSPDLRLRVRPRRVDTEGGLHVPEARIEPLATSAAVPVSRDVVLVNAPEELAARAPWDLHSRVRLTLGDKVRFQGFGLSGHITGGVDVSDEPDKPTTARGELNIVDGKYKAYGRDLDVVRGRLVFAGGPVDNPGIDARAVRRSGEVLAGISVRGTLRSPVLTLFSEPSMSQEDALSYLILGQPLQQAGTAEGRTLVGAAGALSLSGGDMLARRLGARFGFEEVSIQPGETPQEASLVVGRYLSPKLYVSYSVGLFEQVNLLRLRYQLNSRWTVRTETGANSGADLLYTIER